MGGLGGSGNMPRGHGSLSTWGTPLHNRILRARVVSQPEERFGIVPSMMALAEAALADFREWAITTDKDYHKINVHGSCVALGHPLSATGARIITTLTHEMKRQNARYGLIAICGGGMGVAGILERT
ncbi:MAG: hypothetical protein JW932_14915 [Deltaproteobacteria bacterium]|nr:hypothetical protein [Deltaproteobacteria bacterium]